ncbi:PrsW family intramembrane metalloprotease [bacterium]|nr:PrsW family intramembrane metalloprotease [bacterium]
MSAMVVFVSVVASVVPLTAVLLVVWWLDRYEREPLWTLALAFAWGAFGATMFSALLEVILQVPVAFVLDAEHQQYFLAIVAAPPIEEFFKGLFIVGLLFLGRWLDNLTDGVIYGVAVGLGFAMAENFAYFLQSYASGGVSAWVTVIVFRTLFTSAMHAAATATLGACLGFGWQRAMRPAGMVLLALGGYSAAVVMHFIWNSLAVLSAMTEHLGFSLIGAMLIVGAIILYLIVLQVALHHEHKLLLRELEGEAAQGYFPAEHAAAVASSIRRRQDDWLDPRVDQHAYVAVAVRLAMARSRWRFSQGQTREELAWRINDLRKELAKLRYDVL